MPIKLKGATSGDVTLDVTAVAGTNTLTLPAKTGNLITSADTATVTQTMIGAGVAGNGPAFGAYQSSAQTALAAGTWTKIVFQTEEFDTASCFDNATNYRFTPNVAGYYQINGAAQINGSTSGFAASIYKNGTTLKTGTYVSATATQPLSVVSSIVYLNGSTDYVELWGYSVSSLATFASQSATYFNGFLARAA
jgi:hypothetical protein